MINRKYLPSNRFILALSIAIVIVVVAIVFNYWKPNVTKYTNNNLVNATNTTAAFINIDSDKDSLPDWKENLYGTNSNNSDTDGDGTSDGQEVAENRDPLKANTAALELEPNDKIDPAIIERNIKAIEEYKKLTDTEKFSRDLFANIFANQPLNEKMDQATIDSVVLNAIQEIQQKNYTGTTNEADLNLLKTDSTNLNQNLSNYAKNIVVEEQKIAVTIANNLNLIDIYFVNNDINISSEMKKMIDSYISIINNLIKMPVPVAIGYFDVNYHLKIINDLEIMLAINQDNINSDMSSLNVISNLPVLNSVFNDLTINVRTINDMLKITK
jgi:hypothetical protein